MKKFPLYFVFEDLLVELLEPFSSSQEKLLLYVGSWINLRGWELYSTSTLASEEIRCKGQHLLQRKVYNLASGSLVLLEVQTSSGQLVCTSITSLAWALR